MRPAHAYDVSFETPGPTQPLHLAPAEPRLPLGTLLVRDGLLSVARLEEALLEKEETGRRLGEIVVERGWVSATSLARALAEQHELEYLNLARFEIDPAATSLLPENVARRHQALPVAFTEDALLVAVADPTDVVTSDDLRLALGLPLRFGVATLMDLEHAISRVYRRPAEALDEEVPGAGSPEGPGDRLVHVDETAPAIQLVGQIIDRALEDGASHLHFEPQATSMVVRARIDGVTRAVTEIPSSMQGAVVARLKVMCELDIAEHRLPQDGHASMEVGGRPLDLQVAVLPTTFGEQVVLRVLRHAQGRRTLDDLGMSHAAASAFARAVRQPYGAVIACGPRGSGKTTTLYAALDLLNDEGRVLTTIEDPVAYSVPGVIQVDVDTRNGLTFASGLRTILRSDPDVVLVGDVPDEETAGLAVQAALTGHLVLTTLPTHDAASSLARLRSMGVAPDLLATSINCIVVQRLARRLCSACREPYEARHEELGDFGSDVPAGATLHRAVGCGECSGVGYSGRVALFEVLELRGRLRRVIEASTDELVAAAIEEGTTTLRQDGVRLALEGASSLDEIRRVTGDRPA